MSIDHSGPAFPAPEAGQQHFGDPSVYTGMTLRDYFAAKALPYVQASDDFSLKHCCDVLGISSSEYEWPGNFPDFCARMAYKFADAMIKARAATKENGNV